MIAWFQQIISKYMERINIQINQWINITPNNEMVLGIYREISD